MLSHIILNNKLQNCVIYLHTHFRKIQYIIRICILFSFSM